MARTTTKAPAPKAKLANPRNEALARMGKAELLKTVKTLDLRVTKLLNQLARKSDLVATDNVVWLRPAWIGNHRYYELGAESDQDAIGFVPLSPQQYAAACDKLKADTRLPAVSPIAEATARAAIERMDQLGAVDVKFPWEQ